MVARNFFLPYASQLSYLRFRTTIHGTATYLATLSVLQMGVILVANILNQEVVWAAAILSYVGRPASPVRNTATLCKRNGRFSARP